jgi:hypothetical protein
MHELVVRGALRRAIPELVRRQLRARRQRHDELFQALYFQPQTSRSAESASRSAMA